MKNVLFLVMALLFTASAAALQFDAPPDIQMTAVADINPVYIDPGLTDPSGSVVHGDQLAATFDPGDMCPAVQILSADNRSSRDYPSPSQAVKRKPIAYALYASLSANLPDKVPSRTRKDDSCHLRSLSPVSQRGFLFQGVNS